VPSIFEMPHGAARRPSLRRLHFPGVDEAAGLAAPESAA